MAENEKEIGRLAVAISFLQDEMGNVKTRVINRNINLLPEVMISSLRMLVKMLEDDYYPDFRNNITTINSSPDE